MNKPAHNPSFCDRLLLGFLTMVLRISPAEARVLLGLP